MKRVNRSSVVLWGLAAIMLLVAAALAKHGYQIATKRHMWRTFGSAGIDRSTPDEAYLEFLEETIAKYNSVDPALVEMRDLLLADMQRARKRSRVFYGLALSCTVAAVFLGVMGFRRLGPSKKTSSSQVE